MPQIWLRRAAALAVLTGGAVAAERPNILVIMTDDHGYHDLSCQGATDFKTPNIDALAASGARFTDGYVTAPQCGPSRAGLLTGMNQQRFGYINNHAQNGLPPDSVVQTLPEQLKQCGYTTGIIGKWHIGFRANDNEMTLPGNFPWEQGFDYSLVHDSGMSHFYPYRIDGAKYMTDRHLEPRLQLKTRDADGPLLLDGLPPDTYLTDYFSEQASAFVRRNQQEPWFLFLAYNAPHTPCVAKDDKLAKYAHIEDNMRRHMVAMLDSVDEGVGSVLNELEKTGQTHRTLIFFLSDNGGPTDKNGSRNDPFSGLKGDVFEGGIRVPFMVSWPGRIPAGQVLSVPVESLDILPTALSAAGVEKIPAIHEGCNLLPWLEEKAAAPDVKRFWLWCNKSAVRIGDLKETRNGNDVKAIDGTVVPGHIFSDLSENPQELEVKELQNPEKRQMLSNELDAWRKQLEEDQKTMTPPEPPLTKAKKPPPLKLEPLTVAGSQVDWVVCAAETSVVFAGEQIQLTGSNNGQPVAVYLPITPVALQNGQTLRVSAEISTSRTDPRESDIRLAVAQTDGIITTKGARQELAMRGYHFAAPAGGKTSGIRATYVEQTAAQPKMFFNARKAGRVVGTLKLAESVSSAPKTWVVELTRRNDRLFLSGSLGGEVAAQPVDVGGELFNFNAVGLACCYSPGAVLTVSNVSVSVSQ